MDLLAPVVHPAISMLSDLQINFNREVTNFLETNSEHIGDKVREIAVGLEEGAWSPQDTILMLYSASGDPSYRKALLYLINECNRLFFTYLQLIICKGQRLEFDLNQLMGTFDKIISECAPRPNKVLVRALSQFVIYSKPPLTLSAPIEQIDVPWTITILLPTVIVTITFLVIAVYGTVKYIIPFFSLTTARNVVSATPHNNRLRKVSAGAPNQGKLRQSAFLPYHPSKTKPIRIPDRDSLHDL